MTPGGNEILIVEDNADDEELIKRSLAKANVGNPVVVARNGQQAIDYLLGDEDQDLPRVVLLDLCLPRISGHDVLRRLRAAERTSELPIVVLSSSGLQPDIDESYRLGANAYVQKPNRFDDFAAAVRGIAVFWGSLNRTSSPVQP